MKAALALAIPLSLAALPAAADDQQDRGRYLVTAADCVPCHTKPGGPPLAGGRPIETPFGTLYSANLSPDPDTGIGKWTPDQFYRALHEGLDERGNHLYPAFPYNYFTRMPREDTDAMLAYLKTQPAVKQAPTRNDLTWPFSMRWIMAGWNLLFLDTSPFKPDSNKPKEWNRGAYLVEVVGHCGACHTQMNAFGAPKKNEAYQGGHFSDLVAPDITPNKKTGLGSWNTDEIVAFLKTGRNGHGNASAEMGEVVQHSTAKLDGDDLKAIAAYLQSLPASPEQPASAPPPEAQMTMGKQVFDDMCTACHQTKADGVPNLFPPLRHSAEVQQKDAGTLIHIVLTGTRTASTDAAPTPASMPAYYWKLSDDEIAAVITYVRNSWGNNAPAISAKDVETLRKKLIHPKPQAAE